MADAKVDEVLKQVRAWPPEEQLELRTRLNDLLETGSPEAAEDELERRLLEAGLLSEIRPPITDLMPYQNRKPVQSAGKPLSEVIVEERR